MKSSGVYAAIVSISLAVGLSACAPIGMIGPVAVMVDDLQGATVDVELSRSILINSDDKQFDNYTAKIADPSILEFVQGRKDGGAIFGPSLTPKKLGTTTVTLTDKQAGTQPLEFTVTVTE